MDDKQQEELGLQKGKGGRSSLRRGYTTGACATAAAKAALLTLLYGKAPHEVAITLPRGKVASFSIARAGLLRSGAYAVVRKDAGDDPDVTHRALVMVALQTREGEAEDDENKQVSEEVSEEVFFVFRAGRGVGVVTMAGLPVPVGEPAINPVPRRMIVAELAPLLKEARREEDSKKEGSKRIGKKMIVTIGVARGVRLAERTWNARLGIVGGLSILGTTGIVEPYSCSAWIHAIHRGIDVARAARMPVLAAATGRTSETVVRALLGLEERSVIDMGDFAAGMLKYLRRHPVPCLTIAGGTAKMIKLSQGHGDLHSGRSQVDFADLGELARACSADEEKVREIAGSVSVGGVLSLLEGEEEIRQRLLRAVAERAHEVALKLLSPQHFPLGILLVDRGGEVLAHLKAE